ncbi:MAG: hypothetical protein ACOCNL_15885, partial [Acetivibrio ethanolgignens]
KDWDWYSRCRFSPVRWHGAYRIRLAWDKTTPFHQGGKARKKRGSVFGKGFTKRIFPIGDIIEIKKPVCAKGSYRAWKTDKGTIAEAFPWETHAKNTATAF